MPSEFKHFLKSSGLSYVGTNYTKKDFIILLQDLSSIKSSLYIRDDVTIETLNCKISFSNLSSVFA